MAKRNKKERGFTIIELLVVISIIGIISVVILVNYRIGEKDFALERSAYKLTQDIRRIQGMAMGAIEVNGEIPPSYGIHFNRHQNNRYQYILFADLDGDRIYNTNERIEILEFEKGIYISHIIPSPGPGNIQRANILFSPPDPSVNLISFAGMSNIILPQVPNIISIILTYQDGGPQKIIRINKAGLIEIE